MEPIKEQTNIVWVDSFDSLPAPGIDVLTLNEKQQVAMQKFYPDRGWQLSALGDFVRFWSYYNLPK